ncbi:MAG: hypothetical protein WDZ31_01315, partial [Phycisphaeraceae bacterium]
MSDPVFFGILCLVAGLLTGWAGVHLVRSGRRRRAGQEPHCLACDYNLTGNRSAQCPECGLDLAGTRAAVGKRTSSWPRIIGGGIVILVALALLANSLSYSYEASRSSLYHLRPDFIVLNDLRGNALHPRAANELRYRLAAGRLSSASMASARRGVVQRLQAWGPSRMIYSEVLGLANALLQHPQTQPTDQQQLLGGMEQVFCFY